MTEEKLGEALRMLSEQALALADLRKQVQSLTSLTGDVREQAEIMREIKADITAIESRQSALIASITGLASQAIASSKPGSLVQIGGFVLAVTLLILNFIGYHVGVHNGRVSLEYAAPNQTAQEADRARGVGK